MWPFKPKKQPFMRILCEEFLRYEMQPTMGAGGMGTEVDTFAHFAVTFDILPALEETGIPNCASN